MWPAEERLQDNMTAKTTESIPTVVDAETWETNKRNAKINNWNAANHGLNIKVLTRAKPPQMIYNYLRKRQHFVTYKSLSVTYVSDYMWRMFGHL